jgi:hypothetical protein
LCTGDTPNISVDDRQNGDDLSSTPAWPHTRTIEVFEDQVFFKLEGKLCQLKLATICGFGGVKFTKPLLAHYTSLATLE